MREVVNRECKEEVGFFRLTNNDSRLTLFTVSLHK